MIEALIQLRGRPQWSAMVDPLRNVVQDSGRPVPVNNLQWDVPTKGNVYGTLLNFRGELAGLGNAVNEPPYKAPPQSPVLYIKPANTWIGYGLPIPVPKEDREAVQVGASLGVVMGCTACRVPADRALDCVSGYTVVNDISIPHDNLYRPPILQKCRDGFCPIGPWVVSRKHVNDPNSITIKAYINGELRQQNTTANLIRSIAQLIADVTDFMTLAAGDVLMVGVPENAPLARVGDRVAVEIEGIGRLENPIVSKADVPYGGLK